jgi:V8-like Glu-specific endopeptidase
LSDHVASTTKGSPKSGNGFFIHIPGTENDVVLTAGHNLIDETKKLYGQVSVSFFDPASRQFVDREVPPTAIHICPTYKNNPTTDVKKPESRNDYGAILLAREAGHPPHPAFGFSAMLGDEEKIQGDVSVTGYQAGTSGPPVTSSGECINPIVTRNQLEYKVKTEAGISGSPVWIGYNGLVTSVAVQ